MSSYTTSWPALTLSMLPRSNRVEEERRVHRLAHGVVAAESATEVRDLRRLVLSLNTLSLMERQRLEERLREATRCSSMPVATARTFGSKIKFLRARSRLPP